MTAVGRRLVVVLCAGTIALAAAGRASASGTDVTLPMDDGGNLAATLYEPSTPPQAQGYPAIVLFHGLGGNRHQLDALAKHWASTFAVLSFDARGHGQSGGLVSIDGPREIKDTRAVFDWLAARPEIDRSHIGAWGASLGGGAVLRSLVDGVSWAAVEPLTTWTDLYIAQATAGYRLVKGPRSLYIGDFGHAPSTFPGPDYAQIVAEGTRWFSKYLLLPVLKKPVSS